MSRFLFRLLFAWWLLASCATADHVVVSGGPALRKWEDYRTQKDRHDRWWANFIRAATVRIDQIRSGPEADDGVIWLVFRPAYTVRGIEDGKPYVDWISELATKRRAKLVWFSTGDEFIAALNRLPARSVTSFDYFGHSNRYAFMFEYGSEIIASSTAWLHQNDLVRIRSSIFHEQALCTSWGCHTGESMSAVWKKALNVPLRGVKGPTNYVSVGDGKLPVARGSWSR